MRLCAKRARTLGSKRTWLNASWLLTYRRPDVGWTATLNMLVPTSWNVRLTLCDATSISTTDLDTYLVARANPTAPFVYYTGSDWSKRGGGVTDAASWTKAVQEAAREIGAPAKVTLSVTKK